MYIYVYMCVCVYICVRVNPVSAVQPNPLHDFSSGTNASATYYQPHYHHHAPAPRRLPRQIPYHIPILPVFFNSLENKVWGVGG